MDNVDHHKKWPSASPRTLNLFLVGIKRIFTPNDSKAYILYSWQTEVDLKFLLQYYSSERGSNKQTKTIEKLSDHYVKWTKDLKCENLLE